MMPLRSAAVVAVFVALAGAARAQDQEQMKRNLDKKLEAEFIKKAPWILDYDQAKEAAKKSGKLIFAYFSRSYSP